MIREFFQPHPLREFKDYDDYWKFSTRERDTGRVNYLTVKEYVQDAKSLLDVGCGTGEFLRIMHEHHPKIALQGIDIAPKAVAVTRSKGFRAQACNLEIARLPARADVVTCFCVLEHVQNAEQFFNRALQLAKRRVIICIPNPAFLLYRIRYLTGSFPVMSCIYHIKEHIRFWTPKDFRYWIKTLFPQWQIVAVKACATDPLWARTWPTMMANNLYYVLEKAD